MILLAMTSCQPASGYARATSRTAWLWCKDGKVTSDRAVVEASGDGIDGHI
jgi:hypothetical protein